MLWRVKERKCGWMCLQTWEFFCFFRGTDSDFKGNMLYQYEQIGNEEREPVFEELHEFNVFPVYYLTNLYILLATCKY